MSRNPWLVAVLAVGLTLGAPQAVAHEENDDDFCHSESPTGEAVVCDNSGELVPEVRVRDNSDVSSGGEDCPFGLSCKFLEIRSITVSATVVVYEEENGQSGFQEGSADILIARHSADQTVNNPFA